MKIDPKRLEGYVPGCIPIRARDPVTDQWGSFEVPQLDKKSLLEWLKDRPKEYVDDVVGILLGHGHLHSLPKQPDA